MKKVNLRIAELRHKKKITQQELADIVGVSFQTISKWEMVGQCRILHIYRFLQSILGYL